MLQSRLEASKAKGRGQRGGRSPPLRTVSLRKGILLREEAPARNQAYRGKERKAKHQVAAATKAPGNLRRLRTLVPRRHPGAKGASLPSLRRKLLKASRGRGKRCPALRSRPGRRRGRHRKRRGIRGSPLKVDLLRSRAHKEGIGRARPGRRRRQKANRDLRKRPRRAGRNPAAAIEVPGRPGSRNRRRSREGRTRKGSPSLSPQKRRAGNSREQ